MSQALSLSLDCKTGASVPVQSKGRQEELGQTGLEAKVVVDKLVVDKLLVDKLLVDKLLVDKVVVGKLLVHKLVVDRARAGCFSLH